MRAIDFDYHLPNELIAQEGIKRGQSRVLVVNRDKATLEDSSFSHISDYFQAGDCLVINDTKVLAARLLAKKESTGANIELLLHQEIEPTRWSALARPCRKLTPQTSLIINKERFEVHKLHENGKIEVKFQSPNQVKRLIKHYGVIPLPPYIKRKTKSQLSKSATDKHRYQTVFAKKQGSVAAPTSGLHFSKSIINKLKERAITIVPVTLHIGWGTFSGLPEGPLNNMKLHEESFNISRKSADLINRAKLQGHKVIACGTTVTRTLEANVNQDGLLQSGSGKTGLFIKPGHDWRLVDHLITNFHLPQSSLLMLVCAFAGKKLTMQAYEHAIINQYRFYSYGDAMMVL